MSPDPQLKMAEAAIRENEQRSQFIVSDKAIVSAERLAVLSRLVAARACRCREFSQSAARSAQLLAPGSCASPHVE
jgi:hypothetical protein